jgi:hypothetical protein
MLQRLYLRRDMMSIKIKKAPFMVKDDTITDEIRKEHQFSGTYMHIKDVQKGCAFFANKMIEAGINHDDTKMTAADVISSIEDDKNCVKFREGNWYKSHINNNRHHFYKLENCPFDYNLIDVMEAIVDCVMAGKARKGQTAKMGVNFIKPEMLAIAFKNTIEMLENEIIVEE